jgi:hypothetical protein
LYFCRGCASLHSKTHYQILGINQTADVREIRAAYIAQCKKVTDSHTRWDAMAKILPNYIEFLL